MRRLSTRDRAVVVIAVVVVIAGYGYMVWSALRRNDGSNVIGTTIGIAVGLPVAALLLGRQKRKRHPSNHSSSSE